MVGTGPPRPLGAGRAARARQRARGRDLRRGRRQDGEGHEDDHRRRPPRAGDVRRRRPRVRGAREARRHRLRLHGHAVGMARPGDARRAAAGKHCGSECPIGTTLKDLWALVDASEKARQPLPAPRELLLRRDRDAREPHGPRRRVRRDAARGGRVPARPARDPLRESRRRTVAPRVAHPRQRQPVSHARARAGGVVPRHPRGRPVRLHRVGGRARARPRGVPRGDREGPRRSRSGRRSTSRATTTRRSSAR